MIATTNKPNIWFWAIGILALLWNIVGVKQYLDQAYKTEVFLASKTPEQLEAIANQPSWVTAAFAIAVLTGVLGCIVLLLKKKFAKPLFIISVLAVIAQTVYNLFIGKVMDTSDPSNYVITALIVIVALFLVTYTNFCNKKGWLS